MHNRTTSVLSSAQIVPVVALLAITTFLTVAASAQTPPTNFRVDVSYGTAGQLFISWDQQGTDTYVLQRATSLTSPNWQTVACAGPNSPASDSTPFGTQLCRDNNGGQLLSPQTTYYYQVQACASSTCSAFTSQSAPYTQNDPDASSCTLPKVQGLKPPSPFHLATSAVTQNAQYNLGANEFAACANPTPAPGQSHQHILLAQLPGSGGSCSLSPLMYTAQNLGFDAICVNYDNATEQETICKNSNTADPADCLGNISQTKLDYTGDCILNGPNWTQYNCGLDSSKMAVRSPTMC
jgi:hypothetical protein